MTIRSRSLDRCTCCGVPSPLCLGKAPRRRVGTRVDLVIHHIEARKTSNTGRLLVRLLDGVSVRVRGERGVAAPAPDTADGVRRLLLFPAPDARVLDEAEATRGPAVLVVPDGSWAQARRIARRDPAARGAEAVTLPEVAPSRYRLRRNPRPGTLSTFEAVVTALALLEGDAAFADELLVIFEGFVERALALRSRNERPGTPAL